MGDFEDVEAIAENLEMNEREKARYELHKEDIRKYSIRANFWRFWNIIFQVIFFWNIVALALELAEVYSGNTVPSINPFFEGLNSLTAGVTFWFGIFSAFAFFLMIYTGIVRSKWEGKLTRSTAYALSFLSNIEHREFMELEEKVRDDAKAKALKVDAGKVENIVEAAKGVDLIVNALPLRFGENVLTAALEAKANYQDFAAGEFENIDWVEGIKLMITEWSDRFKAQGLSALMSTGSAPGLANVITREAVEELDTCDTIEIHVYEGVWAKRFLPFWWSPEVAFQDMSDPAYCYENGEILETEPFSRPMYMKFRGIDKIIRTVEHAHDEPVTMG